MLAVERYKHLTRQQMNSGIMLFFFFQVRSNRQYISKMNIHTEIHIIISQLKDSNWKSYFVFKKSIKYSFFHNLTYYAFNFKWNLLLKTFFLNKESKWPWAGHPPDHWSAIGPHPLYPTHPWGTAYSWVTLVLGCKGPLNLIKIALLYELLKLLKRTNYHQRMFFLLFFFNWSFIKYIHLFDLFCYKFQLSNKVHKKWWYSTCLNSSPSSIIVPYISATIKQTQYQHYNVPSVWGKKIHISFSKTKIQQILCQFVHWKIVNSKKKQLWMIIIKLISELDRELKILYKQC